MSQSKSVSPNSMLDRHSSLVSNSHVFSAITSNCLSLAAASLVLIFLSGCFASSEHRDDSAVSKSDDDGLSSQQTLPPNPDDLAKPLAVPDVASATLEPQDHSSNVMPVSSSPLPDDVRTVARLISADFIASLSLNVIQSETQRTRNRLSAKERRELLENIANRNEGPIGKLATNVSQACKYLEKTYTSYEDDALSELIYKNQSNADLNSYIRETQAISPLLVSWFEANSNPRHLKNAGLSAGIRARTITLVNGTDSDLSDSIVQIAVQRPSFQDDSLSLSEAPFLVFVESWKAKANVDVTIEVNEVDNAVALKLKVIGWNGRLDELVCRQPDQIRRQVDSCYNSARDFLRSNDCKTARKLCRMADSILSWHPCPGFEGKSQKLDMEIASTEQILLENEQEAARVRAAKEQEAVRITELHKKFATSVAEIGSFSGTFKVRGQNPVRVVAAIAASKEKGTELDVEFTLRGRER